MNCSTESGTPYRRLADFRTGLYACFGTAKDALMNTCDALLTDVGAHSFPELSLSPFFVRRWPSLYEAFDDAKIDKAALQRLFVSAVAPAEPATPLVLAADATPIVRAESPTARDRSYVHVPNTAKGAKPVAPGWQCATVVTVPEQPSSWTTILDNRRVPSEQTPGQVVAQQLRELTPQLPAGSIVLLDGGFGNPTFLSLVHPLPIGKLLRIACNRVLYRPAPVVIGKRGRGRPRADGERFALKEPATHGTPDACWRGLDEQGKGVEVLCWHRLHFQKCREADLSLFRLTREGARGGKRDPRVIWLIWHGQNVPSLSAIPSLYRRRYCIEHSYRFDKQELLWCVPRLRTPEKFEAWTQVVSAVHNQISLARDLTEAVRQPWASAKREPTPSQVRRACGRIIAQLGTPAALPRVRGKSPGRLPGAVIKKAERFKTVWKQTDRKKNKV
jgi:DDE superfamily endonuclease